MMLRTINVLLFENVNLLDVAGPVQAFEAAKVGNQSAYTVRFLSHDGKPVRASCGLQMNPKTRFSTDIVGSDLLIPGGPGVDAQIADTKVLDLIRQCHNGDGRMISVCSGAMVLAAAGVLDGLRATTHWTRWEHTKMYPSVTWDLDQIFIPQGKVITSAGVTTGIDLAINLIETDFGKSTALSVARELIVQLRRTGGQNQYAMYLVDKFEEDDPMAKLVRKIVAEPHLEWSIDSMAEVSSTHPRTLTRRFKRDIEETPAQFVEGVRVDHARKLLEGATPLKLVAARSGFGDLQRMRRAFQRRFGVQVSEYRKMFSER